VEDEEEKKLKCNNPSTESMQPYPSPKAQVAFSEKFGEHKVFKNVLFSPK